MTELTVGVAQRGAFICQGDTSPLPGHRHWAEPWLPILDGVRLWNIWHQPHKAPQCLAKSVGDV